MESVAKKINAKNKAVLIIGDAHIPYEHGDYLDFCKAVSKKYKCEIIINAGDEIDGHAISFHKSESELFSAGHELELAIERLIPWNKAFPKMILLESNHGSLIARRLKHEGIPLRVLKSLQSLYETPKWKWYDDILISTNYGDIYGCHGKKSGWGALAKEQGCSAFQGHFHGKLGVIWSERVEHRRFDMFVGCGINWRSLAFAYGKNHLPKPVLGCGVIDKNGMPHAVKMILNNKGRWTGNV